MTQRSLGVATVLFLSMGCGNTDTTGTATGGASASSGGSSGQAVTGGGGAGVAEGGSSSTDPFAGVEVKPDTDTTPVRDCAGQPDMALCSVVTTPDRWYDICVGGACVSPGCGDLSCNVPAPHFPIPANSNHSHLVLLPGSEPIVVDLVTGLNWQGCEAGLAGEACTDGTRRPMTWQDAVAYCDALGWGGKSDWYLPDSYELFSIVDWAKTGVALDPAFFPGSISTCWTSHFVSSTSVFWIQFAPPSGGSTLGHAFASSTYSARCVRRGSSRDAGYVDQRFVVSAGNEKTIEDRATGLIWQGCVAGHTGQGCGSVSTTQIPVGEWIPYCDALAWGGFDDWRLPTYKELHSLVEYPPFTKYSSPEIDPVVFDVDSSPYLGARSGWEANAVPLLISVDDGARVGIGDGTAFPVMCVRGH